MIVTKVSQGYRQVSLTIRLMLMVVLLIGVLACETCAQKLSDSDVTLSVVGFSQEIKDVLIKNKFRLVDGLNAGLSSSYGSYIVSVEYQKETGVQFKVTSKYTSVFVNDPQLGKPLATYFYLNLPASIAGAIGYYTMYLTPILKTDKFSNADITMIFKKPKEDYFNKDYITIMVRGGQFTTNVFFSFSGKDYEANVKDWRSLERLIFTIGDLKDLNGEDNENHYLCLFLGLK